MRWRRRRKRKRKRLRSDRTEDVLVCILNSFVILGLHLGKGEEEGGITGVQYPVK